MVKRTANQISQISSPTASSVPLFKESAIMEWFELAPGDNFRLITGAEFLEWYHE